MGKDGGKFLTEEEAYMKEWADWMDAPLGILREDQSHLDSIKQEINGTKQTSDREN